MDARTKMDPKRQTRTKAKKGLDILKTSSIGTDLLLLQQTKTLSGGDLGTLLVSPAVHRIPVVGHLCALVGGGEVVHKNRHQRPLLKASALGSFESATCWPDGRTQQERWEGRRSDGKGLTNASTLGPEFTEQKTRNEPPESIFVLAASPFFPSTWDGEPTPE